MKKKTIAVLFMLTVLFSLSNLNAADIKGKVFTLPKEKPFIKGAVLIKTRGEEKYTKAAIDSVGSYFFKEIKPGKYIIKLDLYGLTPFEKEIEVKEKDEILNVDLPISLSVLDKTLVFFTGIR